MENTAPTEPIIPQSETQPVILLKTSTKNKWIIASVILIVLVLLSVGGAYFLKENMLNKQQATLTPSSTLYAKPTLTSNATTNWKTFTSSLYSIKYPSDLKVEFSGTDLSTYATIVNSNREFSLLIETQPTNLKLNDYINLNTGGCTAINPKNGISYIIGSEYASRFEKTSCGQFSRTDIYIIHNEIAYQFSIDVKANYDKYLPLLNQLFSTFKFKEWVPQEGLVANWKTYQSLSVPYSYKYPTDWNASDIGIEPNINVILPGPAGGSRLFYIDISSSNVFTPPSSDKYKTVTENDTYVAGIKATTYTENYNKTYQGIEANSEIISTIFQYKSKYYEINLLLLNNKSYDRNILYDKMISSKQAYIDIYKNILSTFQFTDETYQNEKCPTNGMSFAEAETIALNSECAQQGIQQGNHLGNHYCNSSGQGSWWIDFDPAQVKAGCNPACVIDVGTKTASINWRCTGLQ